MPLEDKQHSVLLCKMMRLLITRNAPILCRMRREDCRDRQCGEKRAVEGDGVEGVGVEHTRDSMCLKQLVAQGLYGANFRTYPWTYSNSIESLNFNCLCEAFTICVVVHNGLGHSNLYNIVISSRDVCRHLPHSTP